MCGIAGLWDRRKRASEDELRSTARRMTDALAHRGPDGEGHWIDAETGVALGQRRLAIVDLSPNGAQPMVSSCGRFVISFNGEVYNAEDLRPQLLEAGRKFRGHSDTEVIVEGFAVWGVEQTLKRLIGMFAFLIWDRKLRRLTLVRDRLGIKPLYWAKFGDELYFGSELKALRVARPNWRPELNLDAVASYVRLNYVPNPHCIYRGVNQLPPGAILTISTTGEPQIERYWTLEDVAREGLAARFTGSEEEAADGLERILSDAVRRRMVADVPLGAFLSGGIDSSTVVALMQANSSRPVRTFTIGFSEQGFDEAKCAADVARHLKTDHTELYITPQHALEVVQRLPDMYDEPFSDSSQIPTFLVSEMTRKHVTVALSGDGGDEMFAGYNRYLHARQIAGILERVPSPVRSLAAEAVRGLVPSTWEKLGSALPERIRPAHLGDKMHKLGAVLKEGQGGYLRRIMSTWSDPHAITKGGSEFREILWDDSVAEIVPDAIERMQYLDSLTYLPDDILTKVDRASMMVALEARVPIIDHRVVAYAWSLPPSLKLRGTTGKWVLRKVLERYVPRELTNRPKMGFSLPIDAWLRGPLRSWAEELINERRLTEEGIFEPGPIRKAWQAHLSGTHNRQHELWNILMFQAWRARWLH